MGVVPCTTTGIPGMNPCCELTRPASLLLMSGFQGFVEGNSWGAGGIGGDLTGTER